ncbi:MAG: response regulator transcription factor [Acidimicrobiia bacterium]
MPETWEWGPEGRYVLLVDDDPVLRSLARGLLEREGHTVEEATSGEAGLAAIAERAPDLLILDIELPEMSGLEVLVRLRGRLDFPVIMMTGQSAETDRVLGLDLGADDYIVKPFLPREFAARVRAVLRRRHDFAAPAPARPLVPSPPSSPGIEIRHREREAIVNGAPVDLTAREFDVLAYLAARPREVVPRAELLESVWGSSEDWQDPATVTEHIRRLRRKIEHDPDEPRFLRTVRGVGYRFEP